MKISYPEAVKRGWSYEDVFVVTFSELDYYVKELLIVYPNGAINNIPEYALQIFKKMLNMWESMHILYSHNQDYVSICTLCRSILDNLAIINHIYLDPNLTELTIKHYLYILDGVNARLKIMEEETIYDGSITCDDYMALQKHRLEIKESDEIVRKFILKELSKFEFIDLSIIEQTNWRYKTLYPNSPKRDNKVSWKTLYQKIDSRPFFKELMNDLSVYVHGLSLSNIGYKKEDETFEPLFSLSIESIDAAIKAVKTIYKTEINKLNLDFKTSKSANLIKLSIKEEYLQTLNDIVINAN